MNFYKIDLKSDVLNNVIGGKSPEPTCSITLSLNPYSEDVDCQDSVAPAGNPDK